MDGLSHPNRSLLCTFGDCILNMVSGLCAAQLRPFGVCFRVVDRMCRCDVWLLLLLAHSGTASVLTDRILSELNMYVLSAPWTSPISAAELVFFVEFKIWPSSETFSTCLGFLKKYEERTPMWRPVPLVRACGRVSETKPFVGFSWNSIWDLCTWSVLKRAFHGYLLKWQLYFVQRFKCISVCSFHS